MNRIYAGTCAACGRQSKYVERDHRVPPRLGGALHQSNMQDLCLDCHRRKSTLEVTLMSFHCDSATIHEWIALAFQENLSGMEAFIDRLLLSVSHFREVLGRIKDARDGVTGEKPTL